MAQHRLREPLRRRLEEARSRPLVALPEPFRILDLAHATTPADRHGGYGGRVNDSWRLARAKNPRQEKGRPSRPLEVWKKLIEAEPAELTPRQAYVY